MCLQKKKLPRDPKYRLTYIKEVNGLNYKRLPLEECDELCKTGNWAIQTNEKEIRKQCYLNKDGDCILKNKGLSFIPHNNDKKYKILPEIVNSTKNYEVFNYEINEWEVLPKLETRLVYDEDASNLYRKYFKPEPPKYGKHSKMRKIGMGLLPGELELKKTKYKRLLERVAIRKSNKAIPSPVVERSIKSDSKVSLEGVRVVVKRFIPKTINLQPWMQFKNQLGQLVNSFVTYDIKYELVPATIKI